MPESQQFPATEISTEIATIYKQHYGRGPTKITTYLLDHAVVCLLDDVNTPAQAALVRLGKPDVAQAVHGELQFGMADAMCEIVARHTGRIVRTYVPGFNADAGATTDVFYLASSGDAGASPPSAAEG